MATMKVKSTLDSRGYKRGIDEMRRKNKQFGKGLAVVKGAMKKVFVAAAIFALVRAMKRGIGTVVQFGSKISDMAAQTGVGVEALQRLQRAVRDAGGQEQHLVNALTRVKDAQGEVITGDKIMTEAFERLGISIDEVVGLDVEGLFVRMSQALTDSGNAANQFSAVADIIGQRNAPKLLEAMNAASGGVNKLGEDLQVMSNRDAQTLDIVADRWANLKTNVKTGAAEIVAGMLGWGKSIDDELVRRQEASERIAALELEQRTAALAATKAKAEEARLEQVEKIAAKEKEAADERERAIGQIRESVTIDVQTDSLRRIGGVAGARVKDSLRLARRQVEILEQIREYEASLPAIEENTAKGGLA